MCLRISEAMAVWLYQGMRRSARAQKSYDVAFYVPWVGPLLTDADVTPTGGAETQVFLLARALARSGSKVQLIVFDLPEVELPRSVDGVDIHVRPPYRAHESLGRLREIASISKAVATADADTVVTRTAGPHVGLVGLSAKAARRRFVFSSASPSDFDFARRSAKRLNQALFRLGVRTADEIVVQTEEQVALCNERFGRSSVLIRSIAETAPRRRGEPEAFLWIGRLVHYKQPLAFVELARALPDAKFWMVSVPVPYSDEGSELIDLVERHASELPNLDVLTPRPRPALMELVERAVAVVSTSEFEGMPNVFLEAWARGVPALTLAYDPDGVVERYGIGAFAQASPERFVDQARQLWDDRMDQEDIGERCRRYIREQHSAEAVSAAWQAVLSRRN